MLFIQDLEDLLEEGSSKDKRNAEQKSSQDMQLYNSITKHSYLPTLATTISYLDYSNQALSVTLRRSSILDI